MEAASGSPPGAVFVLRGRELGFPPDLLNQVIQAPRAAPNHGQVEKNEEIKKHFDGIRVHLRPGASGENIKTISAHIVEEGPTGPFLIDIQLGEENLTHKESK